MIEDTQSFRVYTEDTDGMGIVYHGKYVHFFDRGRTDLLRNHGITLTTMSTYGTYFAVRDLQIRYHTPARLDDLLTVHSCVERAKGCTVIFKQVMRNQTDTILAEATIHLVIVDKQLKPKRMPKELAAVFECVDNTFMEKLNG